MEESQNIRESPICKSDWAVLYLRIMIGAILLLHNVGKMQNYNEIINSYHQLWGVAGATWYVAFSLIEVICAFLLIIGRWVRLSSAVLILGTLAGMIFYFGLSTPLVIELNAVYILLYLLLVITGGGYYSMDRVRCRVHGRV
ncbi:MAG: DoxX family membrane protein [Rikenellaceae bacterium]